MDESKLRYVDGKKDERKQIIRTQARRNSIGLHVVIKTIEVQVLHVIAYYGDKNNQNKINLKSRLKFFNVIT